MDPGVSDDVTSREEKGRDEVKSIDARGRQWGRGATSVTREALIPGSLDVAPDGRGADLRAEVGR